MQGTLGNALSRMLLRGPRRSQDPSKQRSQRKARRQLALESALDVEAPPPRSRTFQPTVVHSAKKDDEDDEDDYEGDDDEDEEGEDIPLNHAVSSSDLDEVYSAFWRDLEMRDAEDAEREAADKEEAKEEIKNLYKKKKCADKQGGDYFMLAIDMLIEDDWLAYDELPGNLYRVWAFNGFKRPKFCFNPLGGFEPYDRNAQFTGTLFVCFIQILAPTIIFLAMFRGWGVEDSEKLHWSQWNQGMGGAAKDWSEHFAPRVLGVLFLFCFTVNSMKVIGGEKESHMQIWKVFDALHCADIKGMYSWPLYLGPFVNCYVTIMCNLCMLLILGTSDDPKDVVFDALGIMFLYNLDDIGGDFAFVGEDDWPGRAFAWIYHEMLKGDDDREDKPYLPSSAQPCVIEYLYLGTYAVLLAMSIVLPFLFVYIPWGNLTADPVVNATQAR